MPKTKTYVRNTKHILSMCFILFALSPCVFKETVFNFVKTEYVKPISQSKTTHQTASCQYTRISNKQILNTIQTKINKRKEPVYLSNGYHYIALPEKRYYHKHSKNFSGNSPPKYILYKRLKLDIA